MRIENIFINKCPNQTFIYRHVFFQPNHYTKSILCFDVNDVKKCPRF